MKVLAIDTTGWSSSVALWEDGEELSFQENTQERHQAAILPQLTKDVLGSHKADLLLVNIGPGSFTGIRVGLAFTKGFSMGTSTPLKGINSFVATYKSLCTQEDVLVLREAHRQDVFAMLFQNGIPQPPQSLRREDIETILKVHSPPFLAGTGLHPFLDGLSFQELSSPWRGAQEVAYAFFKDPSLASDPTPFYVRDADVSLPKGV
jgi:tRNA threonylcarbamoyladenosine biosynthesis protein TsaB